MNHTDTLNALPEPGRSRLLAGMFRMLFDATGTVLLRGEPQLADARRTAVLAELQRRLDAIDSDPIPEIFGALDIRDAGRAFMETQIRGMGRP